MKSIVTIASSTPDLPRKSEGDVIELSDGRLMLAYMEFSGAGSDFDKTRIMAMQSSDGGLTWGRHRVLVETLPGDVNVYSPNLLRARDGSILFLFMRQHAAYPSLTTLYVWKSNDEGETFRPFAECAPEQHHGLCNATVKRLASGRLLLPSSWEKPEAPNTFEGAVLFRDDDGLTWCEADQRIALPMRGVMEPHLEETRDGRVLMVMRSQLGTLHFSESSDDGLTWSEPYTSKLRSPASCPELARIPSTGDLLLIWNNAPYDPGFTSHFGKRSPLTSAISRDEGHTWEHFHKLEDDPKRAFSNPGCRFTSTGRAVINYWTCEYTSGWSMQDIIDLRVAVVDSEWFYGKEGGSLPDA